MGASRREFIGLAGAAAVGSAIRVRGQAPPPRRAPVIDALGEIHLDYGPELLDAIRSTGMRGCVVTVGNPALQGATAFDDMLAEITAYDRHIAANVGRLSRATTAADIGASDALALVYYTQNATPLGDDLARVDALKQLGVRIVQLTYNTRNLLGDGCLERTDSGLSHFGVAVVERMNELRMLVDASHCGHATTDEAIRVSTHPIAITHSACAAVFEHPRCKRDGTLRALADKGGVVGIFQINPYLGPRERNTLDDFLAHVDHAVRVAGIEAVGIGSDREHRTIPDTEDEKQKLIAELSRLRPVTASNVRWPFFISELNHPRRMQTIADALARRGRTSSEIDKILGGNFLRLFRDVWGG